LIHSFPLNTLLELALEFQLFHVNLILCPQLVKLRQSFNLCQQLESFTSGDHKSEVDLKFGVPTNMADGLDGGAGLYSRAPDLARSSSGAATDSGDD
jgi:hypothetical protein